MIISVYEDEFEAICEDDGGWCLECGEEAYGIEQDARNYVCDCCGSPAVFGAEQCLIEGRVTFANDTP